MAAAARHCDSQGYLAADWQGSLAARARGRRGGRPSKMTPAKLRQAERMHAAGTPVTEIADVLGVGRATVYRHLDGMTVRPAAVDAGQ